MNSTNSLRRPWLAAIAGAAFVALPAGALYLYGTAPHAEERAAAQPAVPGAPAPAPATTSAAARYGLPDFTALVDQYGAAVVNISVKGTVKTSARAQMPSIPGFPGFGPDDPMQQFFRGRPGNPQGSTPMRGEGSGFIVGVDRLSS